MKKLLMIPLALYCASSMAVDIQISNVTCTGAYIAVCNDLQALIRDEVNQNLPEVDLDKYASGIANANGFVQKGLGSDYSDVFDYAMVRAGGGLAIQGDLDELTNSNDVNYASVEGLAAGANITIGINLDLLPIDKVGPIELEKLDLFTSFMSTNQKAPLDKTTDVEGDLSSFSLMARYRLYDAVDIVPGNIFQFGGVYLHTGFQRSTFKGDITKTLSDTAVSSGGQNATFTNANAILAIDSTTTTIPIEISAYLRTIWVLTFYGGAGFDFAMGSTDLDVDAGGTVVGNDGGDTFNATINANESGNGEADPTNFRAFGGLQFNLPFFRIYTHINKGLGNDQFGLNAGAKFLW